GAHRPHRPLPGRRRRVRVRRLEPVDGRPEPLRPEAEPLMRRLLALALVPLLAVAGALVLSGARARGDSAYRVDVIFDSSKGIIPGQLVKIAGARVGKVKDVSLTGDYKARIQLEVERRFAPFRTDAACSIQPEGLLAENFVQCDPGTPAGRPLRAQDGKAPTVPVERTTVPVNLN